ncbi:MAG: hypothetical protein ACOYM9_01395 [Bradymonadia bacterium]
MTYTALLIGEPLRVRAAQRVVVCTGGEPTVEPDPAAALERLRTHAFNHVLVDLSALGDAPLPTLRALVALRPGEPLLLLAAPSPPPPAVLVALLAEPWFTHLAAMESPWFMEELAATLRKLEGAPPFGPACVLPWGAVVHSVPVVRSEDKATALHAIAQFLSRLGIGGRVLHRVQDIADEMLMNAIYDAPVGPDGKPRHAAASRTTPVAYAPGEEAVFSFGSDGRSLALSIQDPFGALTLDTVRRYLARGLHRGDDQIEKKAGGAGLGLYLEWESLGSFTVHVEPGRRTEMLGLLDIRGSFRELAAAPKSLFLWSPRSAG